VNRPGRPSRAREDIIAAARRLFYTLGYEKTSLNTIAEASGVPKGNFYYHFRTKDEVLEAVIHARHADISAALERWAQDFPTPRARLERFVEMITREREDLAAYGCPTGSLLTELGKAREDLQSGALEILELYVQFVARQLQALGHPRKRARALAQRLLARAQGAILLAHAYRDVAILDQEVADILGWLESLCTP
jgi:AcrR family transcriptional regulator